MILAVVQPYFLIFWGYGYLAKGIPFAKLGGQDMNETEKRLRRCAFTGHRPEKLGIPQEKVRKLLRCAIEQAYADGFNVFVSGMARGVDLWAADIVLSLREKYPDIKLMCAVPFPGQELRWAAKQKNEYQRILASADHSIVICPEYYEGCYQTRNEWMIDHSSRLVAVWNGKPSGTGNAVRYARKRAVETINLLTIE